MMAETKEEIMAKMNKSATEAEAEFVKTWSGKQVAEWLKKWYMLAVYKRLCKIILAQYK
jgi:deoxyribose-phosphate aldolase